jgi:acetoacetyl-CoA synthetase
VNGQSTAATVEILTEIWQRLLQRPAISPDDNFFDLGGTDPLADRLFAEIARVSGRELPSATICYAPTIATLAALLELPTLPRFSPFVQLRTGSEEPPILIAHGMGGRASFYRLATHLRTGHAIYGIQAKGVDGLEEPLNRVEDMAEFYLNALNQLQRQGPYILIGYSFGGLVALEMAQRLSTNGKDVALLVLVDTYPQPHYLPTGQRLGLFVQRTIQRASRNISNMRQTSTSGAFSHFVGALKRRLHIAGAHPRTLPERSRLAFAQSTLRVKESEQLALTRYRPRFYRGKMRYVRPEANFYFLIDPTAVWKNLVSDLEVETVPGDHLGMVEARSESLAAVLARYVKEAIDTKRVDR